jgi:hypothetical protein
MCSLRDFEMGESFTGIKEKGELPKDLWITVPTILQVGAVATKTITRRAQ